MLGKATILGDLWLIRPLTMNKEVDELDLQVRLCKMLGLAFSLSVAGSLVGYKCGLVAGSAVNLGGIGSLIGLLLALRARKVIKKYKGLFGGIWLVWLCIIAGGIGTLSGPPTIGMLVWRSLR
jgi:hypothetical protein